MKLGIISDFHFGYGWGSEIEDDSFEQAKEAIEKAEDCDVIILCGDIFDSRIPRTDVWARAMSVISKPLLFKSSGVRLVNSIGKKIRKISERTLSKVPVIAIHGTHERRSVGLINPVEALERAGLLVHLHKNTIVLEKEGVKVAIHGMSGVPERYAKDILYEWNPKPIEGCFNILLLHQSISPFVYSSLEPPSLNLSNLPKGFDLIVDGHIHTASMKKLNGTTLLLPGSTIVTQMKKEEAETPKGFYKVDLNEGLKIEFVKLETVRKFFYDEVVVKEGKSLREEIETKIESKLNESFIKKPIIRIKISGVGQVFDRDLRDIERKYREIAIVKLIKEVEEPEVSKKLELLREIKEKRKSVEEIGLEMLLKNLKQMNFEGIFNPEQVFKLLIDGEIERTMNILLGLQATLAPTLKKSIEEVEKKKTPKTGLGKWFS